MLASEVKFVSLAAAAQPLPLAEDADGVIRVGGTRVTLDTVVATFNEGATAEDIVSRYPSLDLADVYAVIAYYLRERDGVEAYLDRRRQEAAAVRIENEKRFDPNGTRNRLLARRAARQS
jgi:uncharacterized protein (DUF433 family)